MTLPPEILEEVAVGEIVKVTHLLLMTDYSESTENEARKLLAEMQAQKPLRGPTFGAVVDQFESTLYEWALEYGGPHGKSHDVQRYARGKGV